MLYAGLDESQAEVKIAGRNSNLRYADDTTLTAESEEELNSLFLRAKEESEKVGLKLNIQKGNIMASGPITLWQIEGEKVEAVDCKEIKKVNPKGNQPSIFTGRADAAAETPVLWPPDTKSWLTGKDPHARKDWRQKGKGTTEDGIVSVTNSKDMDLSKLWELVEDRGAWGVAVYKVVKSWIWLSNWTRSKMADSQLSLSLASA